MKKLLPLVAATLSVGVLAGCSQPAETPGDIPEEPTVSGSVTVLAAASLTDVFDEIADNFRQQNPDVEIVLSYGGSSGLAEQIISGVPADVFASANERTMQLVTDENLTVDPVIFTTNTLEIAVPDGNPGGVTGLQDLAREELAIALCAPEVPCGTASQNLLDLAGVEASVDTFEQDVRAVLTKVSLDEVDASLVYRTDVIAAGDDVEGISVPEAAQVVNKYPITLLTDSASPDVAQVFIDYVLSQAGTQVLEDAGFTAP